MVNFKILFLRSFLQKIRKSLLNAVLTPQESIIKSSFEKNEAETGKKRPKNLLLMFVKVKLGIKRIVLLNAKIFAFSTFLTNMSK